MNYMVRKIGSLEAKGKITHYLEVPNIFLFCFVLYQGNSLDARQRLEAIILLHVYNSVLSTAALVL